MADGRRLVPDDLAALCRLQVCIEPPWSESLLRQRIEGAGSFGLGLFEGDALIGFALFSCLFDEAELLQVAVLPSRRRQGLARQLLQQGMIELSRQDVSRLMLEVRASNAAAIALYRTLGFGEDGRRRNYYPLADGHEDALLMSCQLPQSQVPGSPR